MLEQEPRGRLQGFEIAQSPREGEQESLVGRL